ncbi:dephospho-CoA kinase [Thiocapsa bogorovii]|uniref:dephospho-CoA kinase n=1 Tax=Thiocapsa bogorovii TaxID=521689 RepID=UPI001E3A2A05|nr:dephospho-CoA kinase [Thiocapsa bogorovii]UHD14900.1 dephospho-CoA kinase [Thiocapsa bogorovii]
MLVIGLTGGIGSGKSTVADALAASGAAVIDTDVIARELTEPGQPALREIAATFGADLIGPNGRLNRDALRALVFSNSDARARLEGILHPRIKDRMLKQLAETDAPYAVLVIPLLFETNQHTLVDRVLVVDLPESEQRQRVRLRSGLTDGEIDRIVSSQISRAERLARADDILDNSRDRPALLAQVEGIHRTYLALADGLNDREDC